ARPRVHQRPGAERRRHAQRRELALHRHGVRGRLRDRADRPAALAMRLDGSLGLALLLGIAFGWSLERAGLGCAKKLAGQFYLSDLTVFKVMFSAILTAMLGTFWLGRIGVIDLAAIQVPETFLGPQIVGGLTFG